MRTSLTLEPRAREAGRRRPWRAFAGLVERPIKNDRLVQTPCRLPDPVPIPAPRPRAGLAASAACIALGLALSAPAVAGASSWVPAADGRLVDVEVLVSGRSAPLYLNPGSWDRHYFQAFRGRNYSLAIRNHSGERVGVLISVDGLNVVNGERSSLSGTEPMYVLGPYERAVIRGWRTSMRDVRRFVFVDEERSYAERTGQANGDMGWIRVLSFREQRPQVWVPPRVRGDEEWEPYGSRAPREEGAAPAPRAEGRDSRLGEDGLTKRQADSFHGQPAPESNPGTGWGRSQWDPVQRTTFLAALHATDHIVLRYEYESGLRALGIYPRHGRTWRRDRGELGWGFAQPPAW